MLRENHVRKEELKARAIALKLLGKIFQVEHYICSFSLLNANTIIKLLKLSLFCLRQLMIYHGIETGGFEFSP